MEAFISRAEQVVKNIQAPFGWTVFVKSKNEIPYLMITAYQVKDNTSDALIDWNSRKWMLSEHMTDGEIVQTAFLACMTAVEHEMRETFLYEGYSIFDPHYDIKKLVSLRSSPDALKERS
jgi:hypothetical protein